MSTTNQSEDQYLKDLPTGGDMPVMKITPEVSESRSASWYIYCRKYHALFLPISNFCASNSFIISQNPVSFRKFSRKHTHTLHTHQNIQRFVVVTWNVWKGKFCIQSRWQSVVEIVLSVKPHVICFQEVTKDFISLIDSLRDRSSSSGLSGMHEYSGLHSSDNRISPPDPDNSSGGKDYGVLILTHISLGKPHRMQVARCYALSLECPVWIGRGVKWWHSGAFCESLRLGFAICSSSKRRC